MIAFLASVSDLKEFLLPLIIIGMSMSIPIVAIITDHLQKKERMRLIEKAIEHGADLKNLDIEDPPARPRLPYRSGMILLAVGIALYFGDKYLDTSFGGFHHFPLVVVGLICGCIGIAHLLNDWLNRQRFDD